jgi:hypothetical protein
MFNPPPRTFLHLPRVIFLTPILLIGALYSPPSEGADSLPPKGQDSFSKLQLQIPPGMDDLDSLQADYEKASKDLEAQFRAVVENAPACPNGKAMAEGLKKAPAAQANQREKIVAALDLSKLELQTKVAELDGAAADRSPASLSLAAVAKEAIDAGSKKPLGVITAEQKKIKLHNERMQATVAAAASSLEGQAAKCQEAYKAYFEKAKPLALEIPKKLAKVETGLKAHTEALQRWADTVGRSTAGR